MSNNKRTRKQPVMSLIHITSKSSASRKRSILCYNICHNDLRLFVSFFPSNLLSAGLTQQQRRATRAATAPVNNFISRPRPPLMWRKHTDNMGKHFLFLMSALPPLSSEGRISSLSVTGIEMINTMCTRWWAITLPVRQANDARRGLESSFPSRLQCQAETMTAAVVDGFGYVSLTSDPSVSLMQRHVAFCLFSAS